MSIGLQFLASTIAAASAGVLLSLPDSLLKDGPEQDTYSYVVGHYREFGELPQVETVTQATGARLPRAPERPEYYEQALYNRRAHDLATENHVRLREALRGTTSDDITAAAEAAQAILQACRQSRRDNNVFNARQMQDAVMTRLRNIRSSPEELFGVPTGWPELDVITQGWQGSDLISLVARPGLGKTWILLYMLKAAMDAGRRVLLVSTEMSAEQMGRRIGALGANIDPEYLKTGRISNYALARLDGYYRHLNSAGLIYTACMGFHSTTSEIEALAEEVRPDAIYVDGAYLLRPPGDSSRLSNVDRVSGVFDGLKTLTLSMDRPVVCTTQFGRQAGKGGKEGSLETIGMSDAVGRNSSVVLGLKWGNTIDQRRSRELELLKGREGEHGSLNLHFKFKPTNFSVMDPEDVLAEDTAEGGLA